MQYLPLFADLKNKAVLVIGGGQVAGRKIDLLRQAQAKITVIAPDFSSELQSAITQQQIQAIHSSVKAEHIHRHYWLIIVATNDKQVNQWVAEQATAQNIWVNVVDTPQYSEFIFPAIVDRSPLQIAISSSGQAPVLARRIREQLERDIPHFYSQLAALMGSFRQRVKQKFSDFTSRRHFWEAVIDGPVASLLSKQQPQAAQDALVKQLDFAQEKTGEVYLVGAGPGDPELLTLRALHLMQQADVIIHDGLVSAAILNLARRDATKISVRKQAGNHLVAQPKINELLITHAQQGLRVCRLKGGDPMIFGRGGEEAEALVSAKIPFQIVPGITAAAGCTSYAGIPLTHRDYAQSVQFITGHCRQPEAEPHWPSLVQPGQTLVFYMGLINSETLSQRLITHGCAPNLPCAIIENGTLANQRVVLTDLQQLTQTIKTQQLTSPSLIVVGEVVRLQQKLHWFQEINS